MKITTRSRFLTPARISFIVLGWATSLIVSPFTAHAYTVDDTTAPKQLVANARHVIGLPGINPKVLGKLWWTDHGLGFQTGDTSVFLKSTQILKVSSDDQRYLRGGATGRFARTGIPFCGGVAIALAPISQTFSVVPSTAGFISSLATQARQDIVTVEFLDPVDHTYHGAVFTMPWRSSHALETAASWSAISQARLNSIPATCPVSMHPAPVSSVSLLPMVSEGADVPAHYRVLIYEHLYRWFQNMQPGLQVRRSKNGTSQADCSSLNLSIMAQSFRKGNAVERALIGPVGLFVGTTSLTYHLLVSNASGATLLDEDLRAVIRGDNDSLGLGATIARTIKQKLARLLAHLSASATA